MCQKQNYQDSFDKTYNRAHTMWLDNGIYYLKQKHTLSSSRNGEVCAVSAYIADL